MIADIGCGSFPFFLSQVEFRQKTGLDRLICSQSQSPSDKIQLLNYDVESDLDLPLPTDSCEVITMLAVVEHILPARLPRVLSSVYNSLNKEGIFIITTPAPWTDKLLRALASLNLVSSEEIEEHKAAYGLSDILSRLQQAGFKKANLLGGYFELGMNIWASAKK